MRHFSKSIFKEIARYIYTNQILLTKENMHEIREAAEKLKMNHLSNLTMRVIDSKTDKANGQKKNLSGNFMPLNLSDSLEAGSQKPTKPKHSRGQRGHHNRSKSNNREFKDKPMKTAEIIGVPGLMKIKEATLKLFTTDSAIVLKEIHFCSDLSSTDKEFEIRVTYFYNGLHTDLFYSKVSSEAAVTLAGTTKYVLDHNCVLFGNNREFVISIKFKDEKLRHVLNHSVFQGSQLRIGPYKVGDNAQIIQKIVFT
jgi:hypothetical protein